MLPGTLIKESLKERKISQREFAKVIDVQPSHISEIINGNRKITTSFAQIIEDYLEIPAATLISMQMAIDIIRGANGSNENVAEAEAKNLLEQLDTIINLKSLLKGYNKTKLTFVKRVQILREKYGITSFEETKSQLSSLAANCFRRSATTGLDVRMISTWVVMAKSEALKHKPCGCFSLDSRDDLCHELVSVLHRNIKTDNIQNILGEYGIGFCEVKKLDHASIDGYSFMKDGIPYIVITGRYDRIDNLAFTVMHELGHIFLGHTSEDSSNINIDLRSFNDEDSYPREEEADNFASEHLIGSSIWKLSPSFGIPNPYHIQKKYTAWAKKLNLNPWIVLGRLSHETGIYKFSSDSSRQVHVQKGGVPMK